MQNMKLLVPSYRTRYLLIQRLFQRLSAGGPIPRAFNLGTGQGEYDYMVKGYCRELHACDINVRDIEHAKELNRDQTGIVHAVQDAQANLELSQGLARLAHQQHDAGAATGVDVARAETHVAEDQQNLIQAQLAATQA